jgi:hypothetical protein
MTKTTEAIQHITAGELADDPGKAIEEFDMAAALIDELSSSLAQQQTEAEVADAGEAEPESEDEPEKGDSGGQPEDDEPEGERAEGGVRGSVTEKAGIVGEKVGAVKESIPTPPAPLALAGLGIVAALAALGAVKALSGRGGGAEGE